MVDVYAETPAFRRAYLQSGAFEARLRKRYRSERWFRRAGIAAIVLFVHTSFCKLMALSAVIVGVLHRPICRVGRVARCERLISRRRWRDWAI